MGVKDLERIHPVYRACVDFCKLASIPFTFKEDLGDYETAIQFKEIAYQEFVDTHPPYSEDGETNPEINCPDILDYTNKIIIEIEEETGPKRSGAKYARKGHGHQGDPDTVRDTKRNAHYKNFRVFRLWESVLKKENWHIQLFEFLIDCHKLNNLINNNNTNKSQGHKITE